LIGVFTLSTKKNTIAHLPFQYTQMKNQCRLLFDQRGVNALLIHHYAAFFSNANTTRITLFPLQTRSCELPPAPGGPPEPQMGSEAHKSGAAPPPDLQRQKKRNEQLGFDTIT
jgi:hypothetical protein